MKYNDYINSIQLIDDHIETTLTTGDVDYPGTALEVFIGKSELFNFIISEKGEHQVIVYSNDDFSYRISLNVFEKLLLIAKEIVRLLLDLQGVIGVRRNTGKLRILFL